MKNSIFAIFLFVSLSSFGQGNVEFNKKNFEGDTQKLISAFENIYLGNQFYIAGESSYSQAIEFYLKANTFNPNNAELNFKIGHCYLISNKPIESIPYFEKFKKLQGKKNSTANYYIALANQKDGKHQNAIKIYKRFLVEIPFFKKKKWEKKVTKRILECESAMKFMNSPENYEVDNAGNSINSEFTEHSPLQISKDSLIFTSRRKSSDSAEFDKLDLQYFEETFLSSEGGVKPLDKVQYPWHDALVFTNDKYKIHYYSINGGYLEISGFPEGAELPQINSAYHESSAVFSPNGKTIYFTSNRGGNYDIYFCQQNAKGGWSKAKPLGGNINSDYDEKGLFMHPNGLTLYFSSNGHDAMGGFDIFSVTRKSNSDSWGRPVNLGFPINTIMDDMFFSAGKDSEFAYFSSNRKGGLGKMDIYNTKLDDSFFIHNLLSITIKNKKGEVVDAKFKILTSGDRELLADKAKAGKYKMPIAEGKGYSILVTAENYLFHSENFDIGKQKSFSEVVLNIVLSEPKDDSPVVLQNVKFKYASSKLTSSSFKHLDLIADYLIANPTTKIEISGHTDNTGNYQDNMKLSEERAKSVIDYLQTKKVPKEQLGFKGFASDVPKASNDTPEGREINRRVEFKIIQK